MCQELSHVLKKITYQQILQHYSLEIGGMPYVYCSGLVLSMFGHAKIIEILPSNNTNRVNIILRVPIIPMFPCKERYNTWQIDCIIGKYNNEIEKYIIKEFLSSVLCKIIAEYVDFNSVLWINLKCKFIITIII